MTEKSIIDIETPYGRLEVVRTEGMVYQVKNDGHVRHPNCTAEDAMRALGGYLHSVSHSYQKILNHHLQ